MVKSWSPTLIEVMTVVRSSQKLSASQRLRGDLSAVLFRITILLAVIPSGLTCEAQAQTPDQAKIIAGLERELADRVRLLSDWGGLTRYGSENAELGPPAPGVDRVVFLGDEITEMWGRGKAKFFPGKPFLNRLVASSDVIGGG